MGIFGNRKANKLHKEDVCLAEGIYLKKPAMRNGNIIVNCFLRSLIVFFLVFGTIGGFLSAFDIAYNYILVIVCYLLLSTFFSFLYATSKLIYRDCGYIAFFGVFIGAIYWLRSLANSGFYVVVNTILRRAQTFFDLSGVMEYDVEVDNDYLTVAIVAVFVGMVMMLILNIWMYATMSVAWTVLFTFPILFIPLYMRYLPDALYIIFMLIGYTAVIIFKANGHYLCYAKEPAFRVLGFKKNRVAYTQDGSIFRNILGSMVLFGFFVVLVVQTFFPNGKFLSWFKRDQLRELTQETIGNYVLLGFDGLYNHYYSTGGMSGGKLGGVSTVRPDFGTDLIVSYTPYSNEAVYLKAYTGGRYGENEWESIYPEVDLDENRSESRKNDETFVRIFEEESLKSEALSLQEQMKSGSNGAKGKMDIKNVGADGTYLYYPYYTLHENYNMYKNHGYIPSAQGVTPSEEVTYLYYPKIVWEESLGAEIPSNVEYTDVDNVFLEVPEKNIEVIASECEKIGLHKQMTENEIIDAVKEYFNEKIPYTLKPGATPRDADFVNYFLTKNRKGYCAHFASAATLLFRYMGIPARYVEGYAFSLETALTSELNENKKYEDYYEGYSVFGDAAVVDVEVTDAMAHAWVEVYVPNFGWKVVEVTPGSNEAGDEDDFWSAFSEALDAADFGVNNNFGNFGKLEIKKYAGLIYVVLAVFGSAVLLRIIMVCCRMLIRYRKFHQENAVEALIARYADICNMLRICDEEFVRCRNHYEQLTFIVQRYQIDLNIHDFCKLLEMLSFGDIEGKTWDLTEEKNTLQTIAHAITKQASIHDRWKMMKR